MGSPFTKIYEIPETNFALLQAESIKLYERTQVPTVEEWAEFIKICFSDLKTPDTYAKDCIWFTDNNTEKWAILGAIKSLVTEAFPRTSLDPWLIDAIWSFSRGEPYMDSKFCEFLQSSARNQTEELQGRTLKKLLLDGENRHDNPYIAERPFPFLPTDCFEAVLTPDETTLPQSAAAPEGLIPRVIKVVNERERNDLEKIRAMLVKLGATRTYLYSQAWAT